MRNSSVFKANYFRRLAATGFRQRRALCVLAVAAIFVTTLTHAESKPTQLVVFGDSLVAGYGLPHEDGFTEQLERALNVQGFDVSVTNAGVSGDTTTGGLARLDWTLSVNYDAIVLVLGGNDALRAIPVATVESNLAAILERLTADDIPVLLCGMMAPRNLGVAYTQTFDNIYKNLSEQYDVVFYPHFLEGVATVAHLNQQDGIHPNREGVAEIVRRIMPKILELLKHVQVTAE